MKFRFEDQPHQAAAVKAVVDLFEGAIKPPPNVALDQASGKEGHLDFTLDHGVLEDRLSTVTKREPGIDEQSSLKQLEVPEDLLGESRQFPNFSVEMETGTGKTFVYIETALRLAKRHGIRKFVILVHSVAIRAGVTKTFDQTKSYFEKKFPGLEYQWGVLGENAALDDFLEPSSAAQFLIASIQSIDKPDTGVIYQQAEQPQLWEASGTGILAIARARPVVIIDEPQNFKTELRRKAIATLNPLVALRYSATHAEKFNLVHRLSPKDAAENGLVKRVTIKGIATADSARPYIRVDKLRSRGRRLFAEVMMDVSEKDGPKRKNEVLQNGANLFELSGGLSQYRGLVVDRFERRPDRVIFDSGKVLKVGEETGVDRITVWADQMRHTIRAHLQRQQYIDAAGHDVKVLSLFFVDRVADYWPVDEEAEPVLPGLFDKLFVEEWERAGLKPAECPDPSAVRVHYFPSTKTGIYKDAVGASMTAQEQQARAYEEIIAHKERILTKDNPRAFIFSHSALREGWDNPNVFQVGFLRHSGSEIERRQQIGRGLRLPVDERGRRVNDPSICRLTLVVDETFSEFRDGLNEEYLAAGNRSAPEPTDADKTVVVRRREKQFLSPEFQELWKRIRFKAKYRVIMDAAVLPEAVASSEYLDEIRFLASRTNVVQSAELEYDETGKVVTADSEVSQSVGSKVEISGQVLPNVLRLVEDNLLSEKFPLQLTRPTLSSILAEIPEQLQARALDDPNRWARIVAQAIRAVTIQEMVKHIKYEPSDEEDWWDANVVFIELEEVSAPPDQKGMDPSNGVSPAPADGVNLFDHVIYDSHVEREFSSMLENDSDQVKLFTKLPRRFKVRTPVGEYSPDWAIVFDDDGTKRLYLVRETKGTTRLDDLEWDEAMRIRFAKKHFEAAPDGPVDYFFTSAKAGLRVERDKEFDE